MTTCIMHSVLSFFHLKDTGNYIWLQRASRKNTTVATTTIAAATTKNTLERRPMRQRLNNQECFTTYMYIRMPKKWVHFSKKKDHFFLSLLIACKFRCEINSLLNRISRYFFSVLLSLRDWYSLGWLNLFKA